MKQNLILGFIFLLGIATLSFPLFSNWYNHRVHYSLINEYEGSIEGLEEEKLAEKLQDAQFFNESLLDGSVTYIDPFSTANTEKVGGLNYPQGFEYGKVIGSIEIPKIDVNLPILLGVSDSILARGVGYLPNTSLPVGGEGVHTVLTGHRGLSTSELFRNLDLLEIGDIFYVKSLGQTIAYEVDQIKIVKPNEVDDLRIEWEEDYTTLITCEPYMINTHRLLVRGHRVDYIEDAEVATTSMFFTRYKEYIYAGSALVVILTLGGIHNRRKNRSMKYDD